MAEHDDRQPVLASDVERERAIEFLREGVVGGRLTLQEFSDRVGQAQVARSDRDLAALVVDLPPALAPATETAPVRHRALISRLVRRGPWELPARSSWISVCGTIVLDLRQARLPGREIELVVRNICGTVTVLVPDGVVVDVSGGGWFSSEVIDPSATPPPSGAPRLHIRASGAAGTLHLRASEEDRRLISR